MMMITIVAMMFSIHCNPLHCFTIVSAFKVDVAGGRVNETSILGPRELNLVIETQMIIDYLIM